MMPLRTPKRLGLLCWGYPVPGTEYIAMYSGEGALDYVLNMKGRDVLPFTEGPQEPLHVWRHRRVDQMEGRGSRGLCYFIGGDEGPVKIGFTVDLKGRLSNLRTASPVWLEVLAVRHGGEAREAVYHEQFAADRLHGEWFARTPAILAEIARLNATRPADLGRG